jgi:transcriptional regulator with XRE-family HTH domain
MAGAARRDWIGLHVASLRQLAGMTQLQLADAVAEHMGRSCTQGYVSQIEGGVKPVNSRRLLYALAAALRVDVAELTGQPIPPRSPDDLDIYAMVAPVRAALDDPDEPTRPAPLATLEHLSDRAMAARMSCNYATLRAVLPPLLADSRALWLSNQHPQAGSLFIRACVTAALALKPVGWLDLATRLAERAEQAANILGDPVPSAAAQFTVAQCALAAGNRLRSLTVAARAADVLETNPAGMRNESALAWHGLLNLHAALSAASVGHADDAARHLDTAAGVTRHVHGDPWRMEFTAANVLVWRVGVALENGTPEQAPLLARRVDQSQLRTVQRRARLGLDAGRGAYAAGDYPAAIRWFLAADDTANSEVRLRPSVLELVAQMVRDAPMGGSRELAELARRCGIDPLAAGRNVGSQRPDRGPALP